VEDDPEKQSGVDYDDGERKFSVSESAWNKLLNTIGGDLRWVVRAIAVGIAVVA